MKLMRTSAIALGLSLMATQQARAECCNDFWSCLGAAATAGLSCAVSAAVDELNALKSRIDASRAQAQAERDRITHLLVDDANANAAKAEADSLAAFNATKAAKTRGDAALVKLNSLQLTPQQQAQLRTPVGAGPGVTGNAQVQLQAKPPLVTGSGASAPAPPPASSDADRKREAARAVARLDELVQMSTPIQTEVKTTKAPETRSKGQQAAQMMTQAFEASLIAPMVGLVGTLPPPDPLLTVAIVAGVVATMDKIEQDGNAALAQKAKEADILVQNAKAASDAKVNELRRNQAEAEALSAALVKAVDSKTQADLNALTAKLGGPAPMTVQVQPMAIKPIAVAALKPIGGNAIVSPRLGSQSMKPGVSPVPAAQLSVYKSKTEADVRTRLAANSAADTEKKRAALIAEARTKFANDPKTLQSVIDYLQKAKAQ